MRSSPRIACKTLSPSSDSFNRKRLRNHSEPVSEKRSKLYTGALNFDEDTTLPSETSNENSDSEPKSTETTQTNLNVSIKLSSPVSKEDTNTMLPDNRGLLLEHFFRDLIAIDFEFDGNKLHIIGDSDSAKRIENKFTIMKKLAHLVGCGLDCHFRMANGEYRLLMLVRGAPRVLFGTTVSVIPDLTDTRKYVTPAEFVEAAQAVFFNSILALIPRNLAAAERIILESLMKGNEDDAVRKLYDFLKHIRGEVLSHITTVPIVWTTQDFPLQEESRLDILHVRHVMKQCGEKHLMKLETDRPGYTNVLCHVWGLGPAQTFEQMMESKFNNF